MRTVSEWHSRFVSLLTQYDAKESQREAKRPNGIVNIYRLGHLLAAAQRVLDMTRRHNGNVRDYRDNVEDFFQMIAPVKKFLSEIDEEAANA